jgi:hypothetical protein
MDRGALTLAGVTIGTAFSIWFVHNKKVKDKEVRCSIGQADDSLAGVSLAASSCFG